MVFIMKSDFTRTLSVTLITQLYCLNVSGGYAFFRNTHWSIVLAALSLHILLRLRTGVS